jgi:hypothetical protein
MKKLLQKISVLISLSLILTNCYEELIPPPNVEAITIEYPLGKKAIYAVGYYNGNTDSLITEFITIYSLQFNTHTITNNIHEYKGIIESYGKPYFDIDSSQILVDKLSGEVVLTVDSKWMLFQYGGFIGAGENFMKIEFTESDTTLVPTEEYNQFPLFPKEIIPNKAYSVYRPADDSLFLDVQRNLEFFDYNEWNDIYGNDRGVYYTTEHIIKDFGFTIDFRGLVDSQGLITSSSSFDLIVSSVTNPDVMDTVVSHRINRRIVNFTDPENVNELSWYADYVYENGLIYLE